MIFGVNASKSAVVIAETKGAGGAVAVAFKVAGERLGLSN